MANPNDLSFIIDPGGIPGVREEINLQVFPSSEDIPQFQPYGSEGQRLSNDSLSSGGTKNLYEFQTTVTLEREEFTKLQSLLLWNQNRRQQNLPWEVVIYNLVQPFVEVAPSRSRLIIPETTVIDDEDLGLGLKRWEYWVAIQGSLVGSFQQVGTLYIASLAFREGTFLGSDLESV